MRYLCEVINWKTNEKLRISVEEENKGFAIIEARYKAMDLWGLDDDADVYGKIIDEGE